ncbi:MAG: hypothetical protein ABIE84_02780 [bacterium]
MKAFDVVAIARKIHPYVASQSLRGQGALFNAQLFELAKLRLSKVDLERLAKFINNHPWASEERSKTFELHDPISHDGKTLVALRIKGMLPVCDNEGVIKKYTGRLGFVEKLIRPAGDLRLKIITERDVSHYSPNGSMNLVQIENEVAVASELGTAITQPVLAFGLFENLRYMAEPVGFVIYGMETKEDERWAGHLTSHLIYLETGAHRHMPRMAESLGVNLFAMHRAGFIHLSPHFDNFVMDSNYRCRAMPRVVDLDHAVRLASYPQEMWPALLYIDHGRILNDFIVGLRNWDGHYPVEFLLPFFLKGYFGEELCPPVADKLLRAMRHNQHLPFEYRVPSTIDLSSLIQPRATLQQKDHGGVIDLQDYRDNKGYFGQYLKSLEAIAKKIAA